ncbi:MAG: hypothetical protein ACXVH7_02865 [Thermoanaerobaculia bacterium]
MQRRTCRPHPFYRVPLFHVPRPPRVRRRRYVEGADFDDFRDELRRDRELASEQRYR